MKRVAKHKGPYNIVIEEVDIPTISDTEVLVKAERSLISRGSELWRRYIRPEPIPHSSMGYLLSGTVAEVGTSVTEISPGDRVSARVAHAEYAAVEAVGSPQDPHVGLLPDDVSNEAGLFWPRTTSCIQWVNETGARRGDDMVIIGQGLVGCVIMQVAKDDGLARVIAVDALPSRCEMARGLGADEVVDASAGDPVEAVKALTQGEGADIVVYAVGGRAGPKAFAQGLDMVKRGGLIQVVGLYEDGPLPLDSSKIQGKRLIGGRLDQTGRAEAAERAMRMLAQRKVRAEDTITHRFPAEEAAAAYELVHKNPGEVQGVVLVWD